MGLIIGFISVFLILFLIFAMAVAEWADKDVMELLAGWFKRKKAPAAMVAFSTPASVGQPLNPSKVLSGSKGGKASPAKKSSKVRSNQPKKKVTKTKV